MQRPFRLEGTTVFTPATPRRCDRASAKYLGWTRTGLHEQGRFSCHAANYGFRASVAVVGNGNTASRRARYLANASHVAPSSIGATSSTSEPILVDRLMRRHGGCGGWVRIVGDGTQVTGLRLKNMQNTAIETLAAERHLHRDRASSNTGLFRSARDDRGLSSPTVVAGNGTATSVPGVFMPATCRTACTAKRSRVPGQAAWRPSMPAVSRNSGAMMDKTSTYEVVWPRGGAMRPSPHCRRASRPQRPGDRCWGLHLQGRCGHERSPRAQGAFPGSSSALGRVGSITARMNAIVAGLGAKLRAQRRRRPIRMGCWELHARRVAAVWLVKRSGFRPSRWSVRFVNQAKPRRASWAFPACAGRAAGAYRRPVAEKSASVPRAPCSR